MDQQARAELCATLERYVTGEISVWDFRIWFDRWRRDLGPHEAELHEVLAEIEAGIGQCGCGNWTEPEPKRALWVVAHQAEATA